MAFIGTQLPYHSDEIVQVFHLFPFSPNPDKNRPSDTCNRLYSHSFGSKPNRSKVYHTIFKNAMINADKRAKNGCIFSDKYVK